METYSADPKVGKEPFPRLIPFPAPLPRPSPVDAYLSRLAPSSRLTMAKLIRRLVKLLGSPTRAEEYPWSLLDYARTIALRKTLASRYAPATANLALCALRGVLREAWRLGEEALLAVLAHGFDTLGLPAIVAGHGVAHDNSRKLLERDGFTHTHNILWGTKEIEVCMWGITAQRWHDKSRSS
jgi:hypothetical protein